MSAVQRIARNAALLYVARITSTLLKFFLFIYIARMLGDATLGKFTFAIVFTAFFGILISLGMDDLLVREVARDKTTASKYLGNMIIIRSILSAIAFTLMVIVITVMDYPSDTRLVVFIFGGYAIFSSFSHLFRANFRAFEKMEWDAFLDILESLITTSAGVLLVLTGFGLIEISSVFLFAAIVNTVVSFALCTRKFTRIKFEFDFRFWKSTIKNAVPFSIAALFVLYSRVDTIMLSTMKGDAVVGGYNAAYQIVLAFDPLVITFMGALVPVISRYFISSHVMLQLAYEKSFKYLVIVSFPVSIGGMVLADRIIPLLYGDHFVNSVIALQILIWNCLFIGMNRPMLYMLGAINRQGTSALIAITAIIASIGLNYITIPLWSFIGSGITTLITASFVTMASWYAISRYAYKLNIGKIILKPMIASLVMGAVVYFCSSLLEVNLLLLIVLGMAVYSMLLFLTKGFSLDDRILFREAIRAGRRVT